jgi:arylsulfatase A-like enzyme
MFSGRLAGELGLDQAPGGNPHGARAALEPWGDRLLAAVLSRAGYRCHGFSANLWVSEHAGFHHGFDEFLYAPSQRIERTGALHWMLEGLRASADDGAAVIGSALRESIRSAPSDQPSFWFVNLVECHSPYLPPRPWNDLGALARLAAAWDSQRHLSFESICLHAAGRVTVSARALRRMRHLYARAISYMDAWLGQVLGALSERGMLENTLVIVTADHGESFGEHGLLAHGFSLAEQLIHVPLVAAGPGADALRGEGALSLAELPAVIARAAGITDHPYAIGDGIALARSAPIATVDDQRIVSFAERWRLSPDEQARLAVGSTAATDGAVKLLIDEHGEEQWFRLGVDPDGTAPLNAEQLDPATVSRLRDALRSASVRCEPDRQASSAGSAEQADADTVAALERQMKLLGYM